MGGQEEPGQQPRTFPLFETGVMEELRQHHHDGHDFFGLHVAYLLRDLEPELRLEAEIEILNVIYRYKFRPMSPSPLRRHVNLHIS